MDRNLPADQSQSTHIGAVNRITKQDLYLLCLVLVTATLLWIAGIWQSRNRQEGDRVVIYENGAAIESFDLLADREMTLQSGHVIRIEEGAVSVIKAPCRDQICVRHRPASSDGEDIICLPCRLRIRIESDEDSLDAVTR